MNDSEIMEPSKLMPIPDMIPSKKTDVALIKSEIMAAKLLLSELKDVSEFTMDVHDKIIYCRHALHSAKSEMSALTSCGRGMEDLYATINELSETLYDVTNEIYEKFISQ